MKNMPHVKVTGRVVGRAAEKTEKDESLYLPFRVERAEAFDDDGKKLDVEELEGTPVPLGLFTTIIDKVNLRKLKDAEVPVTLSYPGSSGQFDLLKKMRAAGYDIEGLALYGHFWENVDKFEAYRIEVLPKPAQQNKYDEALSHYLAELKKNRGDYGEKKPAQKIAKSETG